MIGYSTLGSNDLSAAADFFDSLFGALGGKRAYSLDQLTAYSFGDKTPMILITAPFDGKAATHGNGSMVALLARDRAHVDAVHALAVKLGGDDEGAPGPRGRQFYGGYFRDPTGNKFNVCLIS